jgi:hypothetical protein
MPNTIKYSTTLQTLALKKDNFWIGTGDVSKATTSTTDYWSGITPPTGGYTIYLKKASQGPSIYVAANDSEFISMTNRIAESSYTTVYDCLVWFGPGSNKMVSNIDYPTIPTNGITFISDSGSTLCCPLGGLTTSSIDPTGNGGYASYQNGSSYVSEYGGGFRFDGIDDFAFNSVTSGGFGAYQTAAFTWIMICRSDNTVANTWSCNGGIGSNRYAGNGWQTYNPSGTHRVDFYMGDTSVPYANLIGSITPANIDVPHMYVISSNGSNLHKGYIDNGSPVTSTTSLSRTSSTQNEIIWGRDGYIGGTNLKVITYVQIMYDRQLSDAEVLVLYNAYKGRFGF